MRWIGDGAAHRILSSLLIETGAVEAMVRASARRPECSSLAGSTSLLVRGWLRHAIASMATRDPEDAEAVAECEEALEASRLVHLLGELAGDSCCPIELRGHVCTW